MHYSKRQQNSENTLRNSFLLSHNLTEIDVISAENIIMSIIGIFNNNIFTTLGFYHSTVIIKNIVFFVNSQNQFISDTHLS